MSMMLLARSNGKLQQVLGRQHLLLYKKQDDNIYK